MGNQTPNLWLCSQIPKPLIYNEIFWNAAYFLLLLGEYIASPSLTDHHSISLDYNFHDSQLEQLIIQMKCSSLLKTIITVLCTVSWRPMPILPWHCLNADVDWLPCNLVWPIQFLNILNVISNREAILRYISHSLVLEKGQMPLKMLWIIAILFSDMPPNYLRVSQFFPYIMNLSQTSRNHGTAT